MSQACVCTNGDPGAQVCDDAGSRFGSCVCDEDNNDVNNAPNNDPPPNNDPNNNPNNDPNNNPNNDPNNDPNNNPNNDPNNNPNNDPGDPVCAPPCGPNETCVNGQCVEDDDPPPVDECPSANFLDVSAFEGPGGNYPDPQLEVTCTEDTMVVVSNGIIQYEFIPITPNDLQAQNHRWEVPLRPQLAQERTEIPLLGTVAFAVNGAPIYGPNEGAMPDPFGDPVYNDIVDWCLGHTGPNGDYHFHAMLEECLGGEVGAQGPSPILGYALDGFPIYGPRGCVDEDCQQVIEFKSSWVQTGDPSTYAWDNNQCNRPECQQAAGEYLDQCNGRVGPDGTYRYHATTTFPYILGCYSGEIEVDDGGDDNNNMNPPDLQACQGESDCVGACDAGALGCTCHQVPMGDRFCHPTCNNDDDCAGQGMGLTCIAEGVCAPGRP